jgi:DNA-binding NarL/FixJ family response regulator
MTSPASTSPRTQGPGGLLSIALAVADDALAERLAAILKTGDVLLSRRTRDVASLIGSGAAVRLDAVVIDVRDKRAAKIRSEVQEAKRVLGKARLILICSAPGRACTRVAVAAGADAVLVEDDIETALLPAVLATSVDQVVISAPLARGTLQTGALSAREKQILGLVVLGLTNQEISDKLCLAESTVKGHLSSAFSKLDVSSRNEAVAVILDPEHGLGAGILGISQPGEAP